MVTKQSFDLESELRSRIWSFERSDGRVIQPSVTFLRSSRLKNLNHDNEFSWTIAGAVLEFRNAAGMTTTRFDRVESDASGDGMRLSGPIPGQAPNGQRHILVPKQKISNIRITSTPGVCIVVPIHPPYFSYGVNLVVQSLFAEYKLCFVFTSQQERLQFAEMVQDGPAVDYLWIVMEELSPSDLLHRVGQTRSFPTYKKLMALWELSDRYEYIVCVDAETFILRTDGWRERCREIFDRRFWCGGAILSGMIPEHEIIRASACNLAPQDAQAAMSRLLVEKGAYTWWWDLPVYRTKGIEKFFEWINWDNQDWVVERLNFSVFDHITYQYYLALSEEFDIRRPQPFVHSLEFADAEIVKLAHETVSPGAWVNAHAYLQDPEYFRKREYLAVYHLDRSNFPQYTRV
jgi:hypothetical protein